MGIETPYDEGLLCEDCAEAEYVRFWVAESYDKGYGMRYRCPPECPLGLANRMRMTVHEPDRRTKRARREHPR